MINLDYGDPKGIVWLASFPKSGNTWLRAFLFALRKIRSGAAIQSIDLGEFATTNVSDRLVSAYAPHLSRPVAEADKRDFAAARPHVQKAIALSAPAAVFIKTHNARIEDRGWPTINLGVSIGAVYLVRNPLDVAISWARFRGVSVDEAIADMAREGNETEPNGDDVHMVLGSWSQNVRSWTAPANPLVLVIRYEDMLDDPLHVFTAVTDHLAIDCVRDDVVRAIQLSSFDELQSAERASGFLEKPPEANMFFRKGRAGQWRDVLSAEQVDRIVSVHGEQMARFGYLDALGLEPGERAPAGHDLRQFAT